MSENSAGSYTFATRYVTKRIMATGAGTCRLDLSEHSSQGGKWVLQRRKKPNALF